MNEVNCPGRLPGRLEGPRKGQRVGVSDECQLKRRPNSQRKNCSLKCPAGNLRESHQRAPEEDKGGCCTAAIQMALVPHQICTSQGRPSLPHLCSPLPPPPTLQASGATAGGLSRIRLGKQKEAHRVSNQLQSFRSKASPSRGRAKELTLKEVHGFIVLDGTFQLQKWNCSHNKKTLEDVPLPQSDRLSHAHVWLK